MITLWIGYYYLLGFARARKTNFRMMVLPMILLFLLGATLGAPFDDTELKTISVGILDEGTTPLSQPFQAFLSTEGIAALIGPVSLSSVQEGEILMRQGEIRAFIVVEEGIALFYHPRHAFHNYLLSHVVEGFVEGTNAVYAARQLTSEPVSYFSEDNLRRHGLDRRETPLSAMDYYGVTLLVMMMMYGANYSYYSFANEEQEGQSRRLQAAPVGSRELFFGKTLAAVTAVFCQVVLLIFFTKYIYRVNWGQSMLPVLLICLSMALFTNGLGTLIALLVPDENKGGVLLSVLVPATTLLAGGYVPLPSFGVWIDRIKLLSPNYLAQQALFRYIYGGSLGAAAPYLVSLWALIGVLLIAVTNLRRRRVL